MVTRRKFLERSARVLGVVTVPALALAVDSGKWAVEMLDSWDLKNEATHRYRVWRSFDSRQKAEAFVRSLLPQVTQISSAKVGTEIMSLRCCIVSRQSDGSVQFVLPGHLFWNISSAWAFLSNLRVNGQPVPRNSPSGISQCLTEPFLKGNPEIIYE